MANCPLISRRGAVAGAVALLLAGCAPPAPKDGPVTLVLGDQAGLTRAKAEAAGVLAGSTARYTWTNFAGAAPLLEAVNAGAVDTAIAGDAPIVLAAAARIPLKVVAVARSTARGVAILVPPGSRIASVAQLKGHRVVVSSARGSVAQYLLLEALKEAHVDPAAVDIVFMLPGDAASAFAAGQIDAWATFGTYQATAEARGARILRDGRGINTGLGAIAVSQAALNDPAKRAAIAEYLGLQARANEWSKAHPEDYAQIFSKRTGMPIAVARVVVSRENPTLAAPSPADVAALQKVADSFLSFGVLPARVDMAAVVDPTVFPRDIDERPAPSLEKR